MLQSTLPNADSIILCQSTKSNDELLDRVGNDIKLCRLE